MKASEAVRKLQKLIETEGDLELTVYVKIGKSGVEQRRFIASIFAAEMKLPKYADPTQTKTRREIVLS
jgi:hypothetical protein